MINETLTESSTSEKRNFSRSALINTEKIHLFNMNSSENSNGYSNVKKSPIPAAAHTLSQTTYSRIISPDFTHKK